MIGVDILMPEADPLSPERLLQLRRPDADPLASALVGLPGNDVLLARALSAAPSVLAVAGMPDADRHGAAGSPFAVRAGEAGSAAGMRRCRTSCALRAR